MAKILIDGYNLLHRAAGLDPSGALEIEDLLESLRRYKRIKGHSITVVLDGHEGGSPVEGKKKIKGISVHYSKLGEKADQLIERLVKRAGGALVVVTSDRELTHSVEEKGAVVLSSSELMERLEIAEHLQLKGGAAGDDTDAPSLGTRKKGNPKRKSKKERAKLRRLRKL